MSIRTLTSSITIALVLALSAPALGDADPAAEAPSIAPADLDAQRTAGTAPIVIDVRTREEYVAGHVPDAVNIPFDQVAERISEVDAPNGVALYCMVGPRARKGETALIASGYTAVFHLEGGLAAWQEAGLPVDRGD
jgi:phage shock protein E